MSLHHLRKSIVVRSCRVALASALFAAISTAASAAEPATPDEHAAHHPPTPAATAASPAAAAAVAADAPLADQVADLRARLAQLETALQQSKDQKPGMMGGKEGGMMGGGMMAGASQPKADAPKPDAKDAHNHGDQPAGNKTAAEAAPGKMGMAGEMAKMRQMMMMRMMGTPPAGSGEHSSDAGNPGASHLFHIGATGFFLEHADHLKLIAAQQASLNSLKEKALAANAEFQRKIDATEEDVWALTSAAQPDTAKIEAKVRDLEKLYGDQRLAYIRAIADAARILTEDQKRMLLGQK